MSSDEHVEIHDILQVFYVSFFKSSIGSHHRTHCSLLIVHYSLRKCLVGLILAALIA